MWARTPKRSGGEMAGVCAHGKGQGEGREREVMWMEVRAVGERSR